MKTDTQLATTQPEPSIALMLQEAMKGGITTENVAVLERMMGLYERMQDKQAEKDFASAFVQLQQEVAGAKIQATKGVPGKNDIIKFRFAPYEEIMLKVQPILAKNGFTVTFDSKIEECRIVSICTLMHIGGHSRSNSFAARIGGGPPGASESQADGAASTYAKRFALCNALNIVVEQEAHDSDARSLGSPMLEVQWKELQKRVSNPKLGISAEKFLAHAHAASFEAITAERYEDLNDLLTRKEIEKGVRDTEGNLLF